MAPLLEVLTTVNTISLFVHCTIFGSLLINLRTTNASRSVALRYILLASVLYVSCIIELIVTEVVVIILLCDSMTDETMHNIYYFTVSLYILSVCSFYLLNVLRLTDSFKDTTFEISRYKIWLHYINTAVIAICFAFRANPSLSVVSACGALLGLIGLLHLMYTFNHNLFLLAVTQRQTMVNPHADIELNDRQRVLVRTIRKHTILIVGMGVCSITFMICETIDFLYRQKDGRPVVIDHDTPYTVKESLASVARMGLSCCVYLTFNVTKHMYDRACKVCDKECTVICDRLVQKKISKMRTAVDHEI